MPRSKSVLPLDVVRNFILLDDREALDQRWPERAVTSSGVLIESNLPIGPFTPVSATSSPPPSETSPATLPATTAAVLPTTSTLVTSTFSSGGSVVTKQETIFITPTASASSKPDVHHGLSGGSIAGVVIGAIAGVAAIAALVFYLLRRRSGRTKANPQTEAADAPAVGDQPSEKDGVQVSELHDTGLVPEAESGAVHELPSQIAELPNAASLPRSSKPAVE